MPVNNNGYYGNPRLIATYDVFEFGRNNVFTAKHDRLIATYDVFELSVNIYNYVQLCGLIAIYDIFEFYNYLC